MLALNRVALLLIASFSFIGCSSMHPHLTNSEHENACNQGDAKACQCSAWEAFHRQINPGTFHSGETDWPTSDDRSSFADGFFEKACKLGDQSACNKSLKLCTYDTMTDQEKCERGDRQACTIESKKKSEKNVELTKDFWEGSSTKGVLNLQTQERYRYLQFYALSQITNGYGLFVWAGPVAIGWAGPTIAIKEASFPSELAVGTSPAKVFNCVKFLGNRNVKDSLGFNVPVKSYEATKCDN